MAATAGNEPKTEYEELKEREKSSAEIEPGFLDGLADTKFVESKGRGKATLLKLLLQVGIVAYLCFDFYNIIYKPKVIVTGLEGSDQWGSMPTLLVCHDSQYQVRWHAADMFVRHFASTRGTADFFNISEHREFEVTVTNPAADPPGQGGSCLKFSSSLVPFPNDTAVHVDHPNPIAWYVFDFQVLSPILEPNVVGVADTLYLIAEDETGHQSFIGSTPHLYPEAHETVASAMIELVKTKRMKDADLRWTGLTPSRDYFMYNGIQHTVRISNVDRPAYPVRCSSNFSTFCNTSQAAATTMAVVELVISNHDVETIHVMGKGRRALMALGSAGGFSAIIALIYSQFVKKKFKPSFVEVMTWQSPFSKADKTSKGGEPETQPELMQQLLTEGRRHDNRWHGRAIS